MAEQARTQGASVLFVTAPTALVENQMPDWAFGFYKDFYDMTPSEVEGIPSLHAKYVQVVRDTAANTAQSALADVARAWSDGDASGRFRGDKIHLSEVGHRDAAGVLFEAWRSKLSK